MSNTLQQWEKKEKIRRGEPIIQNGLIFYPIEMSHYEEYLEVKEALTLRIGTLPVKYQSKDYLSALFSLEVDTLAKTKKPLGLFQRAIMFLCLSLRIGYDKDMLEKNIILKQKHGEYVVDYIQIEQTKGEIVQITPQDFSFNFRQIMAEQNGLILPNESENLELVQSNEEKNAFNNKSTVRLNANVSDLISSVAYLSHCSEREINNWTVREFENRRRAIDRDKKYTLYGQAEMTGLCQFKNGNPYPSWCYDSFDDSLGTVSLDSIQNKSGVKQ